MKNYIIILIVFISILFGQDIINKIGRKYVIMTKQDTLFTLLNNGRIGLGTTSPIGGLHLANQSATLIFDDPVWGGDVWKLDQWSIDGSFRIHRSNINSGWDIHTPITIDTSGHVGIWTTEPTHALHVSKESNPVRLEGVLEAQKDDHVLTIDQAGEVHWRRISGSAGLGTNVSETDPVWKLVEPNYEHLGQTETITANWVNTTNPWADNEIIALNGGTKGDILYRNSTSWVKLGIGTTGQVLQTNSGATAPEWAASTFTESDPNALLTRVRIM